jgi:hypothetical protein
MTDNKIRAPYQVGDELTLIRMTYKTQAYQDQFRRWHHGHQLVESMFVVITELHEVPGVWNAKDRFVGYSARAASGELYTCNRNDYDETSSAPYRCWSSDSHEVTFAYNADTLHETILVDANGQPAVIDGVPFCPGHGRHFTRRTGCFYCKHPEAWR